MPFHRGACPFSLSSTTTSCPIFLRRELQMDVLLSVVVGELTARSINYLINRRPKPQALDVADHLRRVVLRSSSGRHITNQAIMLEALRNAMCRSYYLLDVFRCQRPRDKEYTKKDQVVSHSLSLSKLSSPKSVCSSSSSRSTQILEQLQKSLDDLSSMTLDVKELVMSLTGYPRLIRQPYSTHLLLDSCMFGRHMEAEHAIKTSCCTHNLRN
jgi:hypothetical protein